MIGVRWGYAFEMRHSSGAGKLVKNKPARSRGAAYFLGETPTNGGRDVPGVHRAPREFAHLWEQLGAHAREGVLNVCA
jgi:hypothetical protein